MGKFFLLALLTGFIITYTSCSSKGGGEGPTNPCNGITITVNGTVTNTSGAGQNNGSISATATGSTNFSFSINGSAFQSSGNFTSLAAGNYTITAKNGSGCTGSGMFTIANGDACAGLSFTVGGTSVNATPCLTTPNGSLTVTTSGDGTGFTYNINGGAFQSSAAFTNLAAGTYTVGAKEAGGCIKTGSVTINPTLPGSLFSAVKTVINTNCAISGCHSGSTPAGNIDFTNECNIVANANRIKVRAVDNFGTGNQMPPPPNSGLSQNDRNAITNWVNAGGLYTN